MVVDADDCMCIKVLYVNEKQQMELSRLVCEAPVLFWWRAPLFLRLTLRTYAASAMR